LRGDQERHEVSRTQLSQGDEPSARKHRTQDDAIEKNIGQPLERSNTHTKLDIHGPTLLQLLAVYPEINNKLCIKKFLFYYIISKLFQFQLLAVYPMNK
jgi:hypothetical protein